MKYIQTIFYVLLLNSMLFAQAPDTLWTRTFGGIANDWGSSVQQTGDGGYIITGTTNSFGAGSADVWLIKTDANGDTLWTKTFGDSAYDSGNAVQQTSDGGYVVTGLHKDGVFLIKTDTNGDSLWSRTFRYNSSFNAEGNSIQQTSEGGYIIAGWTGVGTFNSDLWLLKTDADGDTLWTKTFGGSNYDQANAIDATSDGGYIITGETERSVISGGYLWLLRTDADGDTLWTRSFGDGIMWSIGFSVQQTTDGNFIIAGRRLTPSGSELWLIKADAGGDTLWTRTFGDDSVSSVGSSVQNTSDGGYIVTGSSIFSGEDIQNVLLLKTDSDGETQWEKTIEGGSGSSIRQTSDNGFVIAGSSEPFLFSGNFDLWLIKVAPDISSINPGTSAPINNYRLQQNYPNPFNPATTIEFSLTQSGFVALKVHNILGEEVATLIQEHRPAGQYAVNFDASQLTSGIYYYTLTADGFKQTRKMVLLR